MDKKIYFVVGGTGVIGRGIIQDLVRDVDNFIYFTYHRNKTTADIIEREYGAQKVKGFQADVSDFNRMKDIVEIINKEQNGNLDVLINVFGITMDKNLLFMSDEEWITVLNTNLNGFYSATKPVINLMMRKRSGTIINFSSVSGISGLSGQTNYSATKAGIIGFSKSLAKEVSPKGIRVNVIAPGFIESEMTAKLNEKYLEAMKKNILLGRLGKVEDLLGIVRYLSGSSSSYVTGQVFVIDGGLQI